MKKFVNEAMSAPNVMTVPIDAGVTAELASFGTSLSAQRRMFSRSPQWRSDIRWLSPKTERDFARFRSIFERLDIARHVKPFVDLDRDVRLYNSFLVIRGKCTEPDFHVDWSDNNNEGFTLMTPLTANADGFGLLYKKLDGSIGEYDYKLGEAIVFGDDFVHSTKPGIAGKPVVFLCFNFGTDKMEYWPRIEPTAGRQAMLTCRPDGRFHRIPLRQRARAAIGSLARKAGLTDRQARSPTY